MLKRKTYEKYTIPVSRDAAADVLRAICSAPSPTRKSVAEASGFSEVTVGKVFEKIITSSVASREIRKPLNGGRICTHLTFSNDINLLIIDISTRDFCMAYTSLSAGEIQTYFHIYSDSHDYESNIMKFLSDGMRRLGGVTYSACVLIEESAEHPFCVPAYPHTPIHATCSKDILQKILGHAPDLVITPDVAIKQYFDYIIPNGEASYILMDKSVAMCHKSSCGTITVFKPWNVIIDGLDLVKYLNRNKSKGACYTAVARLVNMLECTFGVENVYIQSDGFINDEAIFEIEAYLRSVYPSSARLMHIPSSCPIQLIGAAYALRLWFMEHTFVGKK